MVEPDRDEGAVRVETITPRIATRAFCRGRGVRAWWASKSGEREQRGGR